jgi:hypothetical protein
MYHSINILRVNKLSVISWEKLVAHVTEFVNVYTYIVWLEHLKGIDYLECKRIWEDIIKIILMEIGWDSVDWIHLT